MIRHAPPFYIPSEDIHAVSLYLTPYIAMRLKNARDCPIIILIFGLLLLGVVATPGAEHSSRNNTVLVRLSGKVAPYFDNAIFSKVPAVQFVWVLGVEGVGHHGMELLLEKAINMSGRILKHPSGAFLRACESKGLKKFRRTLDNYILEAETKQSPVVILMTTSFPFAGKRRLLLNCELDFANCVQRIQEIPIYNISWFVSALVGKADFKPIVLNRGFVATVWSHKSWDKNIRNHARIIAVYKSILTELLLSPLLLKTKRIEIQYESLSNKNKDLSSTLKNLFTFLQWNFVDVMEVFNTSRFSPSQKKVNFVNADEQNFVQYIEKVYQSSWFPTKVRAQPGEKKLLQNSTMLAAR